MHYDNDDGFQSYAALTADRERTAVQEVRQRRQSELENELALLRSLAAQAKETGQPVVVAEQTGPAFEGLYIGPWVEGEGRTAEEIWPDSFGQPPVGTVVDLEEGEETSGRVTVLVGDTNPQGGTCDHCREFYPDSVVVRYRTISLPEEWT